MQIFSKKLIWTLDFLSSKALLIFYLPTMFEHISWSFHSILHTFSSFMTRNCINSLRFIVGRDSRDKKIAWENLRFADWKSGRRSSRWRTFRCRREWEIVFPDFYFVWLAVLTVFRLSIFVDFQWVSIQRISIRFNFQRHFNGIYFYTFLFFCTNQVHFSYILLILSLSARNWSLIKHSRALLKQKKKLNENDVEIFVNTHSSLGLCRCTKETQKW